MAFGLARLGVTASSEGQRNADLRALVHDADVELRIGYSQRAMFSLGAVAEELGFPDVAQRLFNWTSNAVANFGDAANAAASVATPAQALPRPANCPPGVLGFVLFQAGRFQAAREAFSHAIAADPSDADAAIHLARTQIILGESNADIVRTLAPFAQVASLRQDEILKELASALFRAGDPRADAAAEAGTRSERHGIPEFVADLERAVRDDLRERPASADGYLDEKRVRVEWLLYRSALKFLKPHEDHVAFAHLVMQDAIRSALQARAEIRLVINFGVMCGQTDFLLAGEFPHVTFVGVDRNDSIQAANDANFRLPNLRFETADIGALLVRESLAPDALLFHARTLYLLYPAAIRDLYATAARCGIRHVVAVEELGINRATGHFIRFADDGPPSFPYRQPACYGHDYVRYLAEAGYAATRSVLVPMTTLWKFPNLTDSHLNVVHAVRS